MSVAAIKCPFCGADPSPLHVKAAAPLSEHRVAIMAVCPTCINPTTIVLEVWSGAKVTVDWFRTPKWAQENIDILVSSGWAVRATYPEAKTPQAPSGTPDAIARIYKQALNAEVRKDLDAAAMLLRKVLDVSTKELLNGSKKSFFERIDDLTKSAAIPEAVSDWAHEVRVIGNDAAHDIGEPTAIDVEAAREFTDAFLTYVYTMPAKVDARVTKPPVVATP